MNQGTYTQRIKAKRIIAFYSVNPQQINKKQETIFSRNLKQRFLDDLRNCYKQYVYCKNIMVILNNIFSKYFKEDYKQTSSFLYTLFNTEADEFTTDIIRMQNNCKKYQVNEKETAWDLIHKIQNINTIEKSTLIRQVLDDINKIKKKKKDGYFANYPKAKKINSITHFAISLHSTQYKIKSGEEWLKTYKTIKFIPNKQYIRLRIGNSCYFIELIKPPKNCLKVKSISLVWKHGEVFFHYFYEKDIKQVKVVNEQKLAGLDIGYCNYFTLAIDENVYFQSENTKINHKLDKMSKKYAKLQSKRDKSKNKAKYQKKLNKLMNKRDNVITQYKYELNKMITQFCLIHKITHIICSRNILKSKQYKSKLSRKLNRWFGNVPLGELLNTFKQKNKYLIFEEIDESLSSKIYFSVFNEFYPLASALLKQLNEMRKDKGKKSNEYKTLRKQYFQTIKSENVGKRTGRMMKFKDEVMNADVNGAINHINIFLLTNKG